MSRWSPSPPRNVADRAGNAFELRVFFHASGGFGVDLAEDRNGAGHRRVVRCWGANLVGVNDHLLEALKASGYRPDALRPTRRKPFALSETVGVRLGLLLLAVKPLRKLRRIEDVSRAVRELADDEAFYWYAKATGRRSGRRAQRAFRDLVSDR